MKTTKSSNLKQKITILKTHWIRLKQRLSTRSRRSLPKQMATTTRLPPISRLLTTKEPSKRHKKIIWWTVNTTLTELSIWTPTKLMLSKRNLKKLTPLKKNLSELWTLTHNISVILKINNEERSTGKGYWEIGVSDLSLSIYAIEIQRSQTEI